MHAGSIPSQRKARRIDLGRGHAATTQMGMRGCWTAGLLPRRSCPPRRRSPPDPREDRPSPGELIEGRRLGGDLPGTSPGKRGEHGPQLDPRRPGGHGGEKRPSVGAIRRLADEHPVPAAGLGEHALIELLDRRAPRKDEPVPHRLPPPRRQHGRQRAPSDGSAPPFRPGRRQGRPGRQRGRRRSAMVTARRRTASLANRIRREGLVSSRSVRPNLS